MKQSFEITLAGQKLTITSDADAETIRAIVQLVDDRLSLAQRSTSAAGPKSALLVALSLAEDVVALDGKLSALKKAIAKQAATLAETASAMKARKRRALGAEATGPPETSHGDRDHQAPDQHLHV
jgi:cell division protein ZapA (FtsZ GTPase activity inhibitor)